NVVTANDGEMALEAIQRQVPDLISLDLVMPRKSGIRLMMELRKNREWAKIPVIIVTAHARDPKVRNDLDAVLAESTITGPSLYLEKPVTPRKYLESICRILKVPAPAVEEDIDSHTGLREQAHSLLDAADAATLEEVLGRLRDKRN
ncbi:MAG: response regulator, partial [bacterium]|nr:response regulator [bacterium]